MQAQILQHRYLRQVDMVSRWKVSDKLKLAIILYLVVITILFFLIIETHFSEKDLNLHLSELIGEESAFVESIT